ncbi:zinc ribbon domain-containing protein [Chitinophaga sp.]|uniref:zinc ribbon domain-containing protein n=1 Tax=Chitinophaga sp. TaxID=1869181 RepID=UPI0031D68AA5
MHCKHCVNPIDNDSKYCAYCGKQVSPISQFPDEKDLIDNDPVQSDLGLIIAFCIMAGIRICWYVINIIGENSSRDTAILLNKLITKPTLVIFWSVPMVLALSIRYKALSRILLVVGAIILGITVYDQLLKAG